MLASFKCCRRRERELAGGGFAFGAQVGVVVRVDGDVCGCGCRDQAFLADFLVRGELAVARVAPSEDADVAERAAEVGRVAGVEDDCRVSVDYAAFPPERGPVGDVAVVAGEGCV